MLKPDGPGLKFAWLGETWRRRIGPNCHGDWFPFLLVWFLRLSTFVWKKKSSICCGKESPLLSGIHNSRNQRILFPFYFLSSNAPTSDGDENPNKQRTQICSRTSREKNKQIPFIKIKIFARGRSNGAAKDGTQEKKINQSRFEKSIFNTTPGWRFNNQPKFELGLSSIWWVGRLWANA